MLWISHATNLFCFQSVKMAEGTVLRETVGILFYFFILSSSLKIISIFPCKCSINGCYTELFREQHNNKNKVCCRCGISESGKLRQEDWEFQAYIKKFQDYIIRSCIKNRKRKLRDYDNMQQRHHFLVDIFGFVCFCFWDSVLLVLPRLVWNSLSSYFNLENSGIISM